MSVKASPEIIREMKNDIKNTIRDIEKISDGIKTGVSNTSDWSDGKSAEFRSLMQKIASLTSTPIDTLNSAIPKLEKLANALDQYNKVKF